MKKLIIAVVLTVVSATAFCQATSIPTIDGATPGKLSDVTENFIKKGYEFVKCDECSSSILFMKGYTNFNGEIKNVLIFLRKDVNDYVHSITIYFFEKANQYKNHKSLFAKIHGVPAKSSILRSEWNFGIYRYSIGKEKKLIYHTLKINLK